MTDKLPANLLALFQPRPPLRYLPPCDYAPEQRKTPYVSGVAQYLEELRKPDPNYVPTESIMQMRERLREEKKNAHQEQIETAMMNYKPAEDPQIRGDPYRTLFVARLSYDVKEHDLEREFGRFGPIERIRIVRNKGPGPKTHRGYAFIVYEREKDMKAAYKETDGIRIKDRRVLVDVERGRTVKGWKPRRLGGGLGGRGYTKAPVARPSGPSGLGDRGFRASGGGFRGGYQGGRSGFRGGGGGGGGFSGGRFDGPRGPRGGIGYQGAGGFGDRGGYANGGHEAPPNAPTGPGGGRFQSSGGDRGYGGSGGGYANGASSSYRGSVGSGGGSGGYGGRAGGGGYDRDGHGHAHDRHGSSRDDGRSGGYGRDSGGYGGSRFNDDSSRKRPHDGDGYGASSGGDPRRRRY